MDPQLTNLVVSEKDLEAIVVCLDNVQADLNATSVLLLDHSGQVIAARSLQTNRELVTVGALLSGTFYSSRELAKALRENEFKTLYQQGPRESIYAELIGEQWILAIIFRNQTLLGMVRLVVKRTKTELTQILTAVRENNRAGGSWLSGQMRTSFEEAFSSLFRDQPIP